MSKQTSKSTGSGGKVSGRTSRDKGGSVHTTTFVDIPNVGSIRSSYDTDKSSGRISNQHMTKQNK